MTQNELKLYYAPQSRASSILYFLEELGVPYDVEMVDIRGSVPESYREIQPHKKVPAVVHRGVVVHERAAIAIHLSDAYPQAGLAPAIGDPLRGPYLSWLVYSDAVLDPALFAKAGGWQYPRGAASFGVLDDVLKNIERTLSATPYVLGDRFTAPDTQIASGLRWAVDIMRLVPASKVVREYLDRVQARPAFQRSLEKERAFAAKLPPPPQASRPEARS